MWITSTSNTNTSTKSLISAFLYSSTFILGRGIHTKMASLKPVSDIKSVYYPWETEFCISCSVSSDWWGWHRGTSSWFDKFDRVLGFFWVQLLSADKAWSLQIKTWVASFSPASFAVALHTFISAPSFPCQCHALFSQPVQSGKINCCFTAFTISVFS